MASKLNDTDGTDLARSIESLRNDFAKLSEIVSEMAKSQTDAAASRVSAVGASISEAAERVARSGQGLASNAQDQIRGATSELEDQIARNPWTSLLVVGAVGMLLGMMSRNRN